MDHLFTHAYTALRYASALFAGTIFIRPSNLLGAG